MRVYGWLKVEGQQWTSPKPCSFFLGLLKKNTSANPKSHIQQLPYETHPPTAIQCPRFVKYLLAYKWSRWSDCCPQAEVNFQASQHWHSYIPGQNLCNTRQIQWNTLKNLHKSPAHQSHNKLVRLFATARWNTRISHVTHFFANSWLHLPSTP